MRTMPNIRRLCVGLCLAAALPMAGFGQGRDPAEGIGGPLTGPPVLDAPFSADAITTVRLTLPDGTRLDQRTTARYYRDRAGRARVEFRMDGFGAPKTVAERHIRTIVAPDGKDGVFTLDPVTRTSRYLPRSWLAYAAGGASTAAAAMDFLPGSVRIGGLTFAVPIAGNGRAWPVRFVMFRRALDLLTSDTWAPPVSDDRRDESLGKRRIDDVETTGRRVTITIPAGALRNERPFEMVDERWESAELKLLISAHISDSRMGEVEYRLTNIRRVEPPADLFVLPPDYTIETIDHRLPNIRRDEPPANIIVMPADDSGETWITLIYADQFPAVGQGYARTRPR